MIENRSKNNGIKAHTRKNRNKKMFMFWCIRQELVKL